MLWLTKRGRLFSEQEGAAGANSFNLRFRTAELTELFGGTSAAPLGLRRLPEDSTCWKHLGFSVASEKTNEDDEEEEEDSDDEDQQRLLMGSKDTRSPKLLIRAIE